MNKRYYNLDLLKAVSIIAMIICHPVIQFAVHRAGYENDLAYLIGDIFFGDYLGVAHAFMFAMGAGIVFSRRNSAKELIRRGVYLYILGFVLNFCRYGAFAIIDGIIEGEFIEDTVYALIIQDIFHFAGLALIITGLLKLAHCSLRNMAIIAVISSLFGSLSAFVFHRGPVFDYLLGHLIVTTETSSTFTFCNWYIFVVAGIIFGTILKKTEDKDQLYRRILLTAGSVMTVYIITTAIRGPFFMTKNNWLYAMSLPEGMGMLSIDLTMLGAFHFLLKKTETAVFSPFITMSKNVQSIYFIHWCIIGLVDSLFCYMLGFVFPYWFMYLFGIVLIFVSYRLSILWVNRKKKRSIPA